jgi:hypothetical protein
MIACPHCAKSLGGASTDGGVKVRLGITQIDDSGRVHGPCPHCKADVTVAESADLVKAMQPVKHHPRRMRLGFARRSG